jgi:glycosyltransferase involved in cell wall biosynthesis
MKVGILGSRGIPNRYGGFEQLAQYLSVGLIKKGHEVFVYSPHNHPYKEKKWNEVNIIHCKDLQKKIGTAGQFLYDKNCINDARKRNFDVLLHLGYTSDSVWYKRWPKNSINIVNMDGLEWKRSKYGFLTKKFLKWAEALAAKHADTLIADSPGIQDHLFSQYQKRSVYIPYGAEIFNSPDESVLKKNHLQPYSYSLVVARLEPENNIAKIIRGYISSNNRDPLIIVGAPENEYGKYLFKRFNGTRIKFPGSIYDQNELNTLRYFSSSYFHGHSVGGTNPSLLEAMACNCNIIAHDNIFNRAVLKDNADYFSLKEDINAILNSPTKDDIIVNRKKSNIQKIISEYNWESIINAYEKMMLDLTNSKSSIKI